MKWSRFKSKYWRTPFLGGSSQLPEAVFNAQYNKIFNIDMLTEHLIVNNGAL